MSAKEEMIGYVNDGLGDILTDMAVELKGLFKNPKDIKIALIARNIKNDDGHIVFADMSNDDIKLTLDQLASQKEVTSVVVQGGQVVEPSTEPTSIN